jgi:large subunit ribosomal protein L9
VWENAATSSTSRAGSPATTSCLEARPSSPPRGSRVRPRPCGVRATRTLVGHTITVPARAGAAGKLFGSVSAADIVREVESQTGAVVDRKDLVLEEPIKEVGAHNIRVELNGGVIFELNVEVAATD